MIGLALVSIGTFFDELSSILGKSGVQNKQETIYSMAFLSLIWSTLWFLCIIIYKGEFLFSLASLPLITVRTITELVLVHVGTLAVVRADRSTFGFVRTGTIPLLLLTDLYLGYTLSTTQMLGMAILVFALLFAFMNHGIKKEGLKFVILATLLPVMTIALYKYDIAHYNSVEAEQFVVQLVMLIYLFVVGITFGHENPLRLLTKRAFVVQSFAAGIGGVLVSFAYIFAAASTITAAKRAISVLWSILSGNLYFKEKDLGLKITLFLLIALGIALLT